MRPPKPTEIVATALLAAATVAGYFVVRSQLETRVYRDRLEQAGRDYTDLARQFNEAVKRTAVTELVVEGGRLAVVVRTDAGVIERIDTALNPNSEVYIDYALIDGRLLVRRVFDADTPPSGAVVIDPELVEIDWDAPGVAYGKAAYRRLGEGRWAVTVTGSGSLGLSRVSDDTRLELIAPPRVKDYEAVAEQTDAVADEITPLDVARSLLPR